MGAKNKKTTTKNAVAEDKIQAYVLPRGCITGCCVTHLVPAAGI